MIAPFIINIINNYEKIIFTMLFAFVAVASFAQTSTRQVTIHVMDVIGEPLIGAKVEIVGSDQRHIF